MLREAIYLQILGLKNVQYLSKSHRSISKMGLLQISLVNLVKTSESEVVVTKVTQAIAYLKTWCSLKNIY